MAEQYATSVEFGKALCGVLGLEASRVLALQVGAAGGELIRVHITRFLTEDELGGLVKLVSQYDLCRRVDTASEPLAPGTELQPLSGFVYTVPENAREETHA